MTVARRLTGSFEHPLAAVGRGVVGKAHDDGQFAPFLERAAHHGVGPYVLRASQLRHEHGGERHD